MRAQNVQRTLKTTRKMNFFIPCLNKNLRTSLFEKLPFRVVKTWVLAQVWRRVLRALRLLDN